MERKVRGREHNNRARPEPVRRVLEDLDMARGVRAFVAEFASGKG
jgi:hypothetical protein